MKKIVGILTLIAALIAALFAGGAVRPLGLTSTLAGMRMAANGAPGTFMMSDGQLIMMAWEQGAGYAFSVVSIDGKPIADFIQKACGQANKVCWDTMSDFVEWMQQSGWRVIGPASLPAPLVAALNQAVSWINLGARSWNTILVAPAFMLSTPPASVTGERSDQ